MVHSVELLFDADTEAALCRIWDELAAADMPAPGAGRTAACDAGSRRPDPARRRSAVDGGGATAAIACTVGAPLLFGRSNAVLARLIVPTAELLALHAEVHRICGPYLLPGPMPHSLPGQWTAHATVGRRVGGLRLEQAVHLAGEPPEIHGAVAGLRRWDGTERVEYPIG